MGRNWRPGERSWIFPVIRDSKSTEATNIRNKDSLHEKNQRI